MKTRISSLARAVAVRMEQGDEVISSLRKACLKHGIKSGLVFGIGALGGCSLYASRSTERLEPADKELEGPMEMLSASGNITQRNGEPHIHLHAVLGLQDQSCVGGHMKKGTVSLTGEFFILEFSQAVGRRKSEKIGIELLDI